jgi:hypothetical protein
LSIHNIVNYTGKNRIHEVEKKNDIGFPN